MKKIIILLALVFSIGVANALDFNDKVISKNQLPAQAQSFLNEYFAGAKISYAKQEIDFLERSYEVVLADGVKLEFSNKGSWKEVDCSYGEVPSSIIPAPIRKYISENYSGSRVLKIERDGRGYEVKLSNKLELKFNNDFKIVNIDD
ncbi:MAG: PepSY-like domain-containing protein [Bacteroidaceae bacterium]|nr:PepSY-like domain-containing protein [Bacteroidaceae bacterium]